MLPQPTTINLLKYAQSLENYQQKRYINKIEAIKKNPYLMKFNEQVLPKNVSLIEIYEYSLFLYL